MPQFRRKSNTIFAVELTRESWSEARKKEKAKRTPEDEALLMVEHLGGVGFTLETPSGPASLVPGDYIARRNEHDAYVIKRDNFLELYEPCISLEIP